MDQKFVFTFILLLSYPLAFLSLFIWPWTGKTFNKTHVANRHTYNASIGIILGYFAFGSVGLFHFVSCGVYSYALLLQLARKPKTGFVNYKSIPFLLLGVVMAHLSAWQIWNNTNPIDISGVMMVMTVKVSSVAWNILDGINIGDKNGDKGLSSEQKFYAVPPDQFPSIVEFLGFLFFFPTFLTGPSIEYLDYKSWTEGHVHSTDDKGVKSKAQITLSVNETFLPSISRLMYGLFWAGIYLAMQHYISIPYMESPEFLNSGFVNVLWYTYFALLPSKSQFYFVWITAEGACIAMGYGLYSITKHKALHEPLPALTVINQPHDVHLATDGMSNNRALKVEFSTSFGMIYRNWNMKTHHWLKQYVYFRLLQSELPILKDHSTLWTYVTSAFWHGFYPGYYLMFIIGAFMTMSERIFNKQIIPFIFKTGSLPESPLMTGLSIVCGMAMLTFMTIPFVLLGLWNSLAVWKALWFYGVVVIASIQVVGVILPKQSKGAAQKAK